MYSRVLKSYNVDSFSEKFLALFWLFGYLHNPIQLMQGFRSRAGVSEAPVRFIFYRYGKPVIAQRASITLVINVGFNPT
jgi:hypothetical protein